jgi:hypothetical protein
MMPSTGTRARRVKKLARASAWVATSAMLVLCVEATQREWLWTWIWVALALMVALNAIGVIAAITELRAEGRYGGFWPKGSGLSGCGRDDDGPAVEAVHRWRALAVLSRLMPASAGRRWLAEAESLLAEVTDTRRQAAVRSYLLSVPRLAVMMWARVVLRWARPGPRRPG